MVPSGVPREKSPVTPPGIAPGTSRLVAQRLNHYTAPGPLQYTYIIKIQSGYQRRTQGGKRSCRAEAPPPPKKNEILKNIFCRYDIKRSTLNFENKADNARIT